MVNLLCQQFSYRSLLQTEVQRAVHYRLSDTSTLMREAAIDLIGRFILIQPDLTPTYYQMLLERIRVSYTLHVHVS